MTKSLEERMEVLMRLGAKPDDIEPLLEYTSNAFGVKNELHDDGFLERWEPVFAYANSN